MVELVYTQHLKCCPFIGMRVRFPLAAQTSIPRDTE